MALEPALAHAHHCRGEAEAEHGKAHDQRAEMRPAADREDAHDADLQRDDAAGHQPDRKIESDWRMPVEIDGDGQLRRSFALRLTLEAQSLEGWRQAGCLWPT